MRCCYTCGSGGMLVQVGTPLVMMPNATRCKVVMVWRDDEEVQAAGPGENLRIRLSGIDEDQVLHSVTSQPLLSLAFV